MSLLHTLLVFATHLYCFCYIRIKEEIVLLPSYCFCYILHCRKNICCYNHYVILLQYKKFIATIAYFICYDVYDDAPTRSPARLVFFLLLSRRTIFCYIEAKAGLFLLHESIYGVLGKY
jgi:hypothetical protein